MGVQNILTSGTLVCCNVVLAAGLAQAEPAVSGNGLGQPQGSQSVVDQTYTGERSSADEAAAREVILTITVSDGAGSTRDIQVERGYLASLPQRRLETSTSVTEGVQTFEGPLARDLFTMLEIEGQAVVARALNDYEVVIPMSDFEDFDVVLALSSNGEALSRRMKGPIWVVYPRDQHEVLQDVRYDARWIWHLHHLEIR